MTMLALLSLPALALSAAALQERAPAPRDAMATPDPELLALFDYDAGADPALDIVSIQDAGDMRVLDVTYESPQGGRVPGLLFEPSGAGDGGGPYAGLIMMHGMPGSREDARGWAPDFVRRGCVVLAISAPWARSKDGPRLTFGEEDRQNQIQLIQDLRRGVDLLGILPYVDAERIGYVGGSYGGAMGGLLAGVEDRIKAYVLMVGDGGLVAHSRAEAVIPPPGLDMEEWQRWLGWMEPIEPANWVRFARSELLFQNGRADQMVPARSAEAYHAAAEGTRKTVIWYETGHGITGEMLRDQLDWLSKRIGLAAPAGG